MKDIIAKYGTIITFIVVALCFIVFLPAFRTTGNLINPESCVKTMGQNFNFSMLFIACPKASLYKKLIGNFRVGLLSVLISSPGIKSSRARRVLSVIL